MSGKGEHERRHYSVLEKLSPEGVALVDQRFAEAGRKPSYREIADEIRERYGVKIGLSSLSRYFKGVVLPRREERLREIRDRRTTVETMMTIFREKPDADVEEYIRHMVEMGIVANQEEMFSVDPDKLLREHRLREKLKLEHRRLDIQSRRLEGGAALPSSQELFRKAAARVLQSLQGYGEIRPLLKKYSTNISKRLANEAERFDLSEATDG